MKNILTIIALFAAGVASAQFNPQFNKITEKFFPDADLDIHTPAFSKKDGFTDYNDMMAYLNKLAQQHPDVIAITFIGESQKGKKIPMVTLNNSNNYNKVKVWFQGGLHGDEPASTETMLYMLDKLLNDQNYTYLLDRVTLGMVPMANIDGYEKQNRYAANGLDLNRDQVKLMAPESTYLKKAFSDFGAEVAVDFHEYRPFRRDFTNWGSHGVAHRYDAMFMYSANLNLPQNLRDYTANIAVANAKAALDANGYMYHDYVTTVNVFGDIHFNQGTVDARSSTTSYALSNAISSLIEIRGVELGRTSFKRRIHTASLIAEAYLKTAYNDSEKIKQMLAASATADASPEVVVKSKKGLEKQTLTMIAVYKNGLIELPVTVHNALNSTPTLTRSRPYAYILLPGQEKLAQKLQTLGLNVEQLSAPKTAQVEYYTVTAYHLDAEENEGYHEQRVTTTVGTKQMEFPQGSYVIYTDQKNAKLAMVTLEPENDNGFIKFEVLETENGQELPVYRYLTNTKL